MTLPATVFFPLVVLTGFSVLIVSVDGEMGDGLCSHTCAVLLALLCCECSDTSQYWISEADMYAMGDKWHRVTVTVLYKLSEIIHALS